MRANLVSFPSPQKRRTPPRKWYRKAPYSTFPPSIKTSPLPQSDSVILSSTWGSIAYFINYLFGIGILALPYALSLCGWSGLVVLVFVGLVVQHTAKYLAICQYQCSGESYPDIIEYAFGVSARMASSVFLYVELVFETTVFVMVTASSFALLLKADMVTSNALAIAVLIVLSNVCVFPGGLKWLSTIGCALVILLSWVILAAFIIRIDAHVAEWNAPANRTLYLLFANEKPFSTKNAHDIVKATGIFVFCFTGHTIVPSFIAYMRFAREFPIVISRTFAFLQVMYVLFATTGYLAYGSLSDSNILYDLTRHQPVFRAISCLLLILAVSTKYVLTSVPLTESLVDWLLVLTNGHPSEPKAGGMADHQKFQYSSDLESQQQLFHEDASWKSEPPSIQLDNRYSRGKTLKHGFVSAEYQDEEKHELYGAPTSMFLFDRPTGYDTEEREHVQRTSTDPGDKRTDAEKCMEEFPVAFERHADDVRAGEKARASAHMVLDPKRVRTAPIDQVTDRGVTVDMSGNLLPEPSPPQHLKRTESWKLHPMVACLRDISPFVVRVVFRMILPVLSFALTLMFRDLGQLLSFVGGFFGAVVAFILPPLCFLRSFEGENTIREQCMNYLIMMLGVILLIAAVTVNI